MHCIVLSSPTDKKNWKVYRSIEVLAYHRGWAGYVRILFGLMLENRLKGQPNFLRLLHCGNVALTLKKSWPLPPHDDAPDSTFIQSFYGQAFKEDAGQVLQVRNLSPWDEWMEEEPTPVLVWPDQEAIDKGMSPGREITPEGTTTQECESPPFTVWQLGPFSQVGLHLVTFSLTFSGETYRRLVEANDSFSVDGPERLLDRIRYFDLAEADMRYRPEWDKLLADFLDPQKRLTSEAYDVVILGPPFADRTTRVSDALRNGIHTAPLGLEGPGDRFITTSEYFSLPLRYTEVPSVQPEPATA